MNQLFQQLQQRPQLSQQQQLPSLKNNLNILQNILRGGSSPESLIQTFVSNNPQMKNIMQLFQYSKMSPKQFFYHYAKQQGIDPDQFLNS